MNKLVNAPGNPGLTLDAASTAPGLQAQDLSGPAGNRLVLADANGVLSASGQRGTATVGASAVGANVKVVTVTFSVAFAAVPGQVVCTARTQMGAVFLDSFAVTTQDIQAGQFTVNVRRVDANASWGQVLLLDWIALP